VFLKDYPSISQLAHKIAETKVNIIFAVTKDQIPVYNELSKLIEGSTVGELANDSANIVELVKDNYDVGFTLELCCPFLITGSLASDFLQ